MGEYAQIRSLKPGHKDLNLVSLKTNLKFEGFKSTAKIVPIQYFQLKLSTIFLNCRETSLKFYLY